MDDVDFSDIDRHIDSAKRNLDNDDVDVNNEYESKEELSLPAVTMMSSYESNHFNEKDETQTSEKVLSKDHAGDVLMKVETDGSQTPDSSETAVPTNSADDPSPESTSTNLESSADNKEVSKDEMPNYPLTSTKTVADLDLVTVVTDDKTVNNEPTPFKPLTSQDVDQGPLYVDTPKSVKKDELENVEPRHGSSFSEQWSDPLNSFQTDS